MMSPDVLPVQKAYIGLVDQQEWSFKRIDIPLLGEHNLHNVAAALLLIEPFVPQPINAEEL